MKIVNLEEKVVTGISVRTTNEKELNPATSLIGDLYRRFDQVVSVDYRGGARVYGVYHEYASDASGEFTVLAGADRVESATERLERVVLPAGRYMVFTGKGEIPGIVLDTWKAVWEYFSRSDCEHTRAFSKDFEYYRNDREVEIHVAIR